MIYPICSGIFQEVFRVRHRILEFLYVIRDSCVPRFSKELSRAEGRSLALKPSSRISEPDQSSRNYEKYDNGKRDFDLRRSAQSAPPLLLVGKLICVLVLPLGVGAVRPFARR